jgi:hypothetical protein
MTDPTAQTEWISPRAKLLDLIHEYRTIYGPMSETQAIKEMRHDLQVQKNNLAIVGNS